MVPGDTVQNSIVRPLLRYGGIMKIKVSLLSFLVMFILVVFISQPLLTASAAKPTRKATNTPRPTNTPTATLAASYTPTPTNTPTTTDTPTPTPLASYTPTPTSTPASSCATSTPSSGTYTVTICLTSPASGATVTGPVIVSATVTTTGTAPAVQRMIFSLNGVYLLTDFQGPYSFSLPTAKWQDGLYSLSAVAFMRDGYTTDQPPSVSLTFNNGNSQPPTNNNTFTPSTGTTPEPGAPFVVAAGGDGADGQSFAAGVASLISQINPNLFLYLGDVYENGSTSEFYNWYGNNGTNFSAFWGITDPTIGNHEYTGSSAAGYFDYWNNIPNYYSYNAGGWHFISLNSNSSRIGVDTSSAQYQWLASDLAANAQACTIVYYHHPLFNIGPEGPTTSMSSIWALMAQYGVSIVLNGHDHDYQRWVALDANGNPSPTGITEFVAGGAGHGLQTILNTDSRVVFSDDLNPEAFGVLKLTLNSSGASFSYINSSNVILDSGVVPCAKMGPDTQGPTTPVGLTASSVSSTQVNLAWQASSDNVGVAGYTIYRDGTVLTTVAGSTLAYSDTSAMPSTTYSYTVDAYDLAGNHSGQSSPAGATTQAMPTSLIFSVGADTYVNSSNPTINYGSATVWRASNSSTILNGYLRFTVQGLAGYSVTSAYLKVYATSSGSAGISALAVADNTWGENTLTYSNAPPMGAVLNTTGSFAGGTWVTIDVTPYITGEGTYSFGITTPGSTQISFSSKESGSNAAQLMVYLSVQDTNPPTTPTGLTASAVAPAQVDLAWQASTDDIGVAGYTIYRDGVTLVTVPGSTLAYSDTSAMPSTAYSYTMDAFDAAGNHSSQSSPASATTPAMPTSLTFDVAADTYVNSAFPTTNYGTSPAWRTSNSAAILNGYLRFTVQGTAGYPINSAYLLVYATSTGSAGISVLAVADNTWDEGSLTYSNAPSMGAVLNTTGSFASGAWVMINVTSYITGDGTYSFGITTPGTTQISFAAKESGSNAAQLVVYPAVQDTNPPTTPTGLTASAVAPTQVNLAWQASTDDIGVAGYTVYRDGVAIVTVSGSTLSYSDTSAMPSTTYSYTVDAFDDAGNHSSQSDPASATTPAQPSSLTFVVGADSYVNSSYPDTNFGSSFAWRVANSTSIMNGYLSFTVQGTAGYPIQSAYLMVYANSKGTKGISALTVGDNTWDESTITYSNAPPMGAVLNTTGSFAGGTWLTIDVTSYITGDGTYSFGITTPGTTQISFAAKESGANAALLVINFAP
jgi:chitodextrinase